MKTTRSAVAPILVTLLSAAGCASTTPATTAPVAAAPTSTTAPASASASPAAPSAPGTPAPALTLAEKIARSTPLLVDAWNTHDTKKLAELYAAKAVLKIPGVTEGVGRDAIMAEAQANFAGFPDFKLGLSRAFLNGNVAVVEWVATGTNNGPFLGQKSTGRSVGVAGVTVFTYDDDGLIKEEHRYFDATTISSQLDAKAAAGSFRPIATLPPAVETHVSKGTPEEAKTLDEAKAMYAAFESKKWDSFHKLVTEDSVMDDLTQPGSVKGAKGLKTAFDAYAKTFPDFAQAKPVWFAADGYSVVEGVFTGTQKGALGPLKATNKPVSLHFVDIFQMKDGKVVRGTSYANSVEILREIGALPPPAAAAGH
jgi:steroid delta-isomerase-like uncharacterized protein